MLISRRSLRKKNMGWEFDPFFLTSPLVGKRASHNRLSCSQDRHQFQWLLANSCDKLNRFSFGTFFLAGFRDCGLLELHLLVLSHMSPCELHMCSYFRTISRFLLYRRVHFCFIVIRNFIPYNKFLIQCFFKCTIFNWITRYTFEHPYLLSTTHSSQPCSSCYRLASSIIPYLSISEKSTGFVQH
jgi:hypothetical protein